MSESYVSVNGHRVTRLYVLVGNKGPWVADLDLEQAPDVSGRVEIKLGDLVLSGTVDASHSGTFGAQRKLRVVGGAGGWSGALRAKHYHTDAGVKAQTVATDAAREAGETIQDFAGTAATLGVDYVRQAVPASVVLERAAAGALWWVDFAGNTHVGARPAVTLDPKAYQVLDFDPRSRLATVTADDPRSIVIGATLAVGLDAPQVVREFAITATADDLRFQCWCDESTTGPLVDVLRGLVQHFMQEKLFGTYRYRVVRMSVDRVELQAVRKGAGLPDVLPVSCWPGVAGVHAELTPGAEVLVEFVEGDRTMPVVSHFAGKDGKGFVPVALALDATTTITLGAAATMHVALAEKVDVELAAIAAVLTSLCTLVGVAPNPYTFPGTPPLGTPPTRSTAASKVLAE